MLQVKKITLRLLDEQMLSANIINVRLFGYQMLYNGLTPLKLMKKEALNHSRFTKSTT